MNNFLLSISNGFMLFGHEIRFYGLISATAYLLGIILVCVFAKKRGLKTDDIISLACYVIPLAVIGARLGYVIFKHEQFTNFWDIFKIWEGGLMFYGGLVGGAVAVMIYCLIHKKNFLALLDIIAPALVLSQAVGRWGNFFNQEAYGNYIDNPSLQFFPFGVYIDYCLQTGCLCDGNGWHMATFFYESAWNILSFAILTTLLYKAKFTQNGMIAAHYLVLYGIGRIIIEGLRTDSLYLGNVRISQLLSGIFIVLGLGIILFNLLRKRKKKDSFDIIMDVLKKDL